MKYINLNLQIKKDKATSITVGLVDKTTDGIYGYNPRVYTYNFNKLLLNGVLFCQGDADAKA